MHANGMAWMVGLALLASCTRAAATDDEASTPKAVVWRCWWNQALHVTCAIERIPAGPRPATPVAKLPQFVAALRSRPQDFRGRLVHIPLHTHPFQMDSVRVLARAVMCGASPDCRVRFSAELPQAAELDRLVEPVLAGGG